MSENLRETVRLQSKKRKEWTREVRGETVHRTAGGRSSAPRLANLTSAPLSGKNQCPGSHCSLMVKVKRKNSPARCAREFKVKEKP